MVQQPLWARASSLSRRHEMRKTWDVQNFRTSRSTESLRTDIHWWEGQNWVSNRTRNPLAEPTTQLKTALLHSDRRHHTLCNTRRRADDINCDSTTDHVPRSTILSTVLKTHRIKMGLNWVESAVCIHRTRDGPKQLALWRQGRRTAGTFGNY